MPVSLPGGFITALMDSGGSIAFLLAAMWGFWNYANEPEFDDYWLMYGFANVLAALWAGASAAEWFGFHPEIMDSVSPMLAVTAAGMWGMAATVSYFSVVKQSIK